MAEYINRQALLRFLNDIWLTTTPNDFMPDDDRHLAMVRCMGLNDAMDAVKSIPTADVVPVVRGKWKEDWETGCSECSACHDTLYEIQELLETRRVFGKHLPQTNADRIRSMTDEELAEFLMGDGCPDGRGWTYRCVAPDDCTQCWLDWLRKEAANENI